MRQSLKHRSLVVCTALALGIGGSAVAGPGAGKSKNMDRPATMDQRAVKKNDQEARVTRERVREAEDEASERSREMQTRSEERKTIKEQYREEVRTGEREKVKGKKPWWKFWGSDDGD